MQECLSRKVFLWTQENINVMLQFLLDGTIYIVQKTANRRAADLR